MPGSGFAAFAVDPVATRALLDLVLDPADTFVTFVTLVTARHLLRRQDPLGLAVVARALATADDNHADWIHDAIHDVFFVFARDRDQAVQTCQTWPKTPTTAYALARPN